MMRSLIELESTAVAAAGRTSNPPHRHMQVEKMSSSSSSISASVVASNAASTYILPTDKLSFADRLYLDTPKVVTNSPRSTATSTSASTATYLSIASITPALAGGLSGVMTKVVTQPLDFLRTRLQVHDNARPGLCTTFGTIWRSEGALSFYRGLSANLMGSGFNWGAYFLIYEVCKSGLSYCQTNGTTKPRATTATDSHSQSQSQSQLNSFHHFVCAYTAGASSVLVTNPIWMIKTRLQIRNDYKGVFDCAKRIYLEEGPFRFYRGIVPGLVLCSNKAIQFTVYEKLKFYANFYYFNPQHKSINDTTLPSRYYLVMGGLSKVISATATYPMHLLRARLFQSNSDNTSKYNGIIDCVKRVYKHEGAFGFYKGVSASLLKTVPGSALTFCFYENLMVLFSFVPKEHDRAE